MEGIILASSLGAAFVEWLAIRKAWKLVEYIAKPGMMVLLLAWFYAVTGFKGPTLPFALGLFFSFIGDILLILPRPRFLLGLAAFLAAHIGYIVGFIYPGMPLSLMVVGFGLIIAVASQQIYVRISAGLTGEHRRLKLPVLLYTLVISLMLLFAVLTPLRPEWKLTASLFAAGGALLFYISDALLGYNKFVQSTPNGRLTYMVLYQLGQLAIAISAVLQFAS